MILHERWHIEFASARDGSSEDHGGRRAGARVVTTSGTGARTSGSFASGPNPIISCLGIHAIVRSTLDPAGPPVLLYLSLHMSVSRVLDIRTFCKHHKTVLENHSQEGEAERSNTSRTIHPANP